MWCMCWPMAVSRKAAGRNWRWSWKRKAMRHLRKKKTGRRLEVQTMTATRKKDNGDHIHPLLTGCVHPVDDDAPRWVSALRETAADSFAQSGLPTPAWEDWKYTSLRALDGMNFTRSR